MSLQKAELFHPPFPPVLSLCPPAVTSLLGPTLLSRPSPPPPPNLPLPSRMSVTKDVVTPNQQVGTLGAEQNRSSRRSDT